MSDKTCQIAAQYVCHSYATAYVRPYENRQPLANAIDVVTSSQALPEAGHHRVHFQVTVTATNPEGVTCFETGIALEAIVVERELSDLEREAMLSRNIPGLLLGTARTAIETMSLQTGYGPVTLPPLSGEQLLQMSRKGQTP